MLRFSRRGFQRIQSGRDTPTWKLIELDCKITRPKPVIDLEPIYEDRPVDDAEGVHLPADESSTGFTVIQAVVLAEMDGYINYSEHRSLRIRSRFC